MVLGGCHTADNVARRGRLIVLSWSASSEVASRLSQGRTQLLTNRKQNAEISALRAEMEQRLARLEAQGPARVASFQMAALRPE